MAYTPGVRPKDQVRPERAFGIPRDFLLLGRTFTVGVNLEPKHTRSLHAGGTRFPFQTWRHPVFREAVFVLAVAGAAARLLRPLTGSWGSEGTPRNTIHAVGVTPDPEAVAVLCHPCQEDGLCLPMPFSGWFIPCACQVFSVCLPRGVMSPALACVGSFGHTTVSRHERQSWVIANYVD